MIDKIKIYPLEDIFNNVEICNQWDRLAEKSTNIYSFYQSPTWLKYSIKSELTDHIVQQSNSKIFVAVYSVGNEVISLVPFQKKYIHLKNVVKSYNLLNIEISVINLISGQPLVIESKDENFITQIFSDIIEAIISKYSGRCVVRIPYINLDNSHITNLINGNKFNNDYHKYFTHAPICHYQTEILLTFDEYLKKFKSKTRSNLKRNISGLSSAFNSEIELYVVDSNKDVILFLSEAAKISQKSWQIKYGDQIIYNEYEISSFQTLAEKGYLRSYLLKVGKEFCAFVRGFQFGNTYYYSRVAFSQDHAKWSPGTVLLYLIMEDLHVKNKPLLINFQEGEYEYKKIFSNSNFNKSHLLTWKKNFVSYESIVIIVSKLIVSVEICIKKYWRYK